MIGFLLSANLLHWDLVMIITPLISDNTTPTRVYCELFVRSFGSPNPLTMVSYNKNEGVKVDIFRAYTAI